MFLFSGKCVFNSLRVVFRNALICCTMADLHLIEQDENMPVGWDLISQTVFSAFDNENTAPCILVIDAVNQLDNADSQSVLAWLPFQHKPQIKVCHSAQLGKTEKYEVNVLM